jgi:hypothetical protein
MNKEGLLPDSDEWAIQESQGAVFNSYDDLPKCYVFYFTKTIGGMNETYVNPQFRNLANEQIYGSVWMPECVTVVVSDNGVQSVVYSSNPSNAEIVENSAKIISFEEVIDRFSKQVELSGVWGMFQYDEDIVERRINIDKIELGGMRIISKDNTDEYLYIPVWSFFGSVTEKWAEGTGDTNQLNENNEFTNDDLAQCILTINAIDGSVINRSLGY